MNEFRKLDVWDRAQTLCVEVYRCSSRFPREEQYGITSQMRRSAVSIASNIAEGSKRGSDREFAHFLSVAQGSTGETMSLLDIVKRLEFLDRRSVSRLSAAYDELAAMLAALRQQVRDRADRQHG
jgi:four helix bundle protein